MNDYIIVALVDVLAVAFLLFAVRFWLGSGLLTQIFRVVLISVAVIAYITFIMGKQGITFASLSATVIVGCTLVIAMLLVMQKTIIVNIQVQSDTVSRVVKSLTVTSNEAAASAEEQSSTVAQVGSAVEEIHQMSQNTANTSQDVVKVTTQAVEQGKEGIEAIREALHVMERFTQAISFVEVVKHVAEQSNLLALNAGIEAAKAEEYGRGFSVVASEVRNLAVQSKQAVEQIHKSLKYTESGQRSIQTTDSVIMKLGEVLEEASEKARQISGAALQQSAGIKQISDAMLNLIQSGQHTELTSKQIRDAAKELADVTHQLSVIIHGQEKVETLSN